MYNYLFDITITVFLNALGMFQVDVEFAFSPSSTSSALTIFMAKF